MRKIMKVVRHHPPHPWYLRRQLYKTATKTHWCCTARSRQNPCTRGPHAWPWCCDLTVHEVITRGQWRQGTNFVDGGGRDCGDAGWSGRQSARQEFKWYARFCITPTPCSTTIKTPASTSPSSTTSSTNKPQPPSLRARGGKIFQSTTRTTCWRWTFPTHHRRDDANNCSYIAERRLWVHVNTYTCAKVMALFLNVKNFKLWLFQSSWKFWCFK